jgi:hypothetical protein
MRSIIIKRRKACQEKNKQFLIKKQNQAVGQFRDQNHARD